MRAAASAFDVRRSVIGGFERAAEFRGTAPRLDHAALGFVLYPARPAQREQMARRAQLLGQLYFAATFLGRELFYQIHADHSVVRIVCIYRPRGPRRPRGPSPFWTDCSGLTVLG